MGERMLGFLRGRFAEEFRRARYGLIVWRHQQRRGICDSPCFLLRKQLRGWLECPALKDPLQYDVSNDSIATHTRYEFAWV
jgi:hypothetical protein